MILDDIMSAISSEMPKMNTDVLYKQNDQLLENSPQFIADVYKESEKFLGGLIHLEGYEVLDPERRILAELEEAKGRFRIPSTLSHLQLNCFTLRYGEKDRRKVYIYTFYTHHHMLVFNGKRTAVFKGILEKTFSRVQDSVKNGISVNPIRVHLMFERRNVKAFMSVTSGHVYRQFIIGAHMYYGPMSKRHGVTTVLLYLLAKFGFTETLKKFCVTKRDVTIVDEITLEDTDKYEYFLAIDQKTGAPPVYLKVRTTFLDDPACRKLVVNLLYVMTHFDFQTKDTMLNPNTLLWKTMLGIIISNDTNHARAQAAAQGHFNSVDHFIDPITRERFTTFGVDVTDIYDTLVYIFANIDDITVNSEPQNLYTKRFDVSKGILSETFGKKIFHSMYNLSKKSSPTVSDIRKALKISMNIYQQTINRKAADSAMYITRSPEIVGDNWLFACGMTKIRLGGKPEQRLHPSNFVVESGCTISGKTINQTGAVNPYVLTDKHGGVIIPDCADEFEPLVESL